MIISVCIPCMGRTHDLRVTMPHIIEAANASPPVEIMVLDYNSQDGLGEYIEQVRAGQTLIDANTLSYSRYTGRDYYHMAHAWNLCVKTTFGEYIVIMGTDTIPDDRYFTAVRMLIADGCVWMHGKTLEGILVCKRDEFLAAGGYDERFEFYGPEDKDLEERLVRRGGKFGLLPDLLRVIPTAKADKTANYRITSRHATKKLMVPVYNENRRTGALVVNEGRVWGEQL